MKTIVRINQEPPFPERSAREQTLRTHFRGDVQFIDWTPPEDPGQLFNSLREKLMEVQAVAVEIDSDDRFLSAILAVGVTMHVFGIVLLQPPRLEMVPVLLPLFVEGRLTGYVELKNVITIANRRPDILIA